MGRKPEKTGSELFIVDNSDRDWKVADYLRGWCELSKSIDIATGFFEIGALLELQDTDTNDSRRTSGSERGRELEHAQGQYD